MALLIALPTSATASWTEIDARTLGLGGAAALDRLDRSPGAPLVPSFGVQLGQVWHFLGSGLETRSLRFCAVGTRLGWAVALDQMQSDIHWESDGVATLQIALAGWRFGVGVGVHEMRFERYAPWRDGHLRLGVGVRFMERARIALVGAQTLQRDAPPRLAGAAGWALQPALEVSLQVEREPALPMRLRAGLAWGGAGPLVLLCGYDAATGGTSGGLGVGAGPWRVTYGTLSHPELGWSHAWMLEFVR